MGISRASMLERQVPFSYIRHPRGIPIDVFPISNANQFSLTFEEVGVGGLLIFLEEPLLEGTVVEIVIRSVRPVFRVRGIVQWCYEKGRGYEIGLQFADQDTAFRVRMMEQICHIEAYRKRKQRRLGKRMLRRAAAFEWIQRKAGDFPNPSSNNHH